MRERNIEFLSRDFEDVEICNDSFIYADPPYLISTATYNENNNWNESDESRLLKYLDKASQEGAHFALSNFIQHNGRENYLLIEWAKKYNIRYIKSSYSNSSYRKSRSEKKEKTVEVLITNY